MIISVLASVVGALGVTSGVEPVEEAPNLTVLTTWRNVTLNGGFVVAGCGMKYANPSTITVTGIPATATVQEAYLYWAVQGASVPLPAYTQGNFDANPIVGSPRGNDTDPCWGNNQSYTYRADVTAYVPGNGAYVLTGFANQGGGNTPICTGASLFVIYSDSTANGCVIAINEGNDNIPLTHYPVTWTITGFTAPNPVVNASVGIAAQDGQVSSEGTLLFNSTAIDPGPDVWQGTDPPGGNYWDTHLYDVTALVAPASISAVVVQNHTGSGDCVNFVASILGITTNQPVYAGASEGVGLGDLPRLAYASGRLTLTLPRAADVRVLLYDAGGRLTTPLARGRLGAGKHEFSLNLAPRRSPGSTWRCWTPTATGRRSPCRC